MCFDPISLAGMALSVGGSILNGRQEAKNEQRMADARSKAMLANFARQNALSDQARTQFQDALTGFDKPKQQQSLQDVGQERANNIQANLDNNKVDYTPVSENAPQVVKSEIAKRMSEAMQRGRSNALALGNMGAWGENQFGNQVNLGRSGGRIGELSNFTQGVAGLMPIEMNAAANNARKSPSMIGDLFKLAGGGLSAVGGGGGFGNVFGGGAGPAAPGNDIYWFGPRWGG